MDLKPFIVKPDKAVRLDRFSTDDTHGVKDQEAAKRRLVENLEKLADQQERLYVDNRHAVLVVMQAMDAAGKDSTIKHVMSGINPQGVQVTSFKAPSAIELEHDYLWRSIVALPPRGTIGIHNRSYYEEVLITRVHSAVLERQQLPDRARRGNIFKRRYRAINRFEDHLHENGTTVVKLFLHVSRDEQRRRLLNRIERPDKHWKFSLQDLKERSFWGDYVDAYEHMLSRTSTETAPWHVVPADNKWYLHLVVSEILLAALKSLKLEWPALDAARQAELAEGKRLLELEARTKTGQRARGKGQR